MSTDAMEWLDAPADLGDALVLIALPTTGQVASIAAQYLIKSLNLPLVGSLWPDGMAGVVAVDGGRVISPLRVYGGEVACELDGGCPRVFIVTSNLPISPEIQGQVVGTISAWAATGKASRVMFLEGVVREDNDDTPDVFCAARGAAALAPLVDLGFAPLPRGLLVGSVALFLAGPLGNKPHRGALLVEATPEQADGFAAAELIKAIDVLIPHIKIDAEPLLKEALALEEAMAKEAAQDQQSHGSTFI